jgi:hypothetical protein
MTGPKRDAITSSTAASPPFDLASLGKGTLSVGDSVYVPHAMAETISRPDAVDEWASMCGTLMSVTTRPFSVARARRQKGSPMSLGAELPSGAFALSDAGILLMSALRPVTTPQIRPPGVTA